MGKIFSALEKSQGNNSAPPASSTPPPASSIPPPASSTPPRQGNSEDREHEETISLSRAEADLQQQHSPAAIHFDPSLVIHTRPHSVEAEQFRILKNSILFPGDGRPPRSIMVTSTAPGEGKSFVAANLAVSIAKSIDEYVLLMDCDLRMPSIHSKFGFSDIPGLSEYLSEARPLSSILKQTAIGKLSFLPAGRPPANPSELISSDQMTRLLDEVTSRYDDRYVIIDSPPPYLTSEANALARQVDAIVIVIKSGQTKKGELQDLIDTYGRKKILGVVKNFSDQTMLYGKKKSTYGY